MLHRAKPEAEAPYCSFAGRIAPLRLTLSPGHRERCACRKTLKPQFYKVLMDLFQRAPLLARLGRVGLDER